MLLLVVELGSVVERERDRDQRGRSLHPHDDSGRRRTSPADEWSVKRV
jgi:hypothetical protein